MSVNFPTLGRAYLYVHIYIYELIVNQRNFQSLLVQLQMRNIFSDVNLYRRHSNEWLTRWLVKNIPIDKGWKKEIGGNAMDTEQSPTGFPCFHLLNAAFVVLMCAKDLAASKSYWPRFSNKNQSLKGIYLVFTVWKQGTRTVLKYFQNPGSTCCMLYTWPQCKKFCSRIKL